MNIKKFQEEVLRPLKVLESEKENLCHAVMGMHSELNEIMDASDQDDDVNLGEEYGDLIFYMAAYCNFRKLDLQSIWDAKLPDGRVLSHIYWTSKLQDLVKKFLVYDKDIDVVVEVEILQELSRSVKYEMDMHDLDIKSILQNNIDKLRVRYPEKFSNYNAINRNLKAERKELEKK